MSFSVPHWDSSKNLYSIRINSSCDIEYNESRTLSSGSNFFENPTTTILEFQDVMSKFANKVYSEGVHWFSTPIKPSLFMKKVKHIFQPIPEKEYSYGNLYTITWKPKFLQIYSNTFEINWFTFVEKTDATLIPCNLFDELHEIEPKTIIIQQHENELLENIEIPFENSESVHLPSRANFKQKVRRAKLKAAIATMKAEQMAEKYFRRYGIQTHLDSESELSLNSGSEDSNEE